MDVKEKIEKTDNDEEKSRLIHKHIKQIQIVKRTIPYQRKTKWIKSTEIEAKYVTITFFDGSISYFYLICNNGSSGKWILSDDKGGVLEELNIPIVQRFVNATKEKERKAQDKKLEDEYKGMYNPKDLQIRGFEAMAKFLCMSSAVSVRKRYLQDFFEDSITVDDNGVHIMDAARALEIMKASKNAWIIKILNNFYQIRKKKGK